MTNLALLLLFFLIGFPEGGMASAHAFSEEKQILAPATFAATMAPLRPTRQRIPAASRPSVIRALARMLRAYNETPLKPKPPQAAVEGKR